MASQQQQNLVGYLVHKPGGAFGRLKSCKRQYYMFEDRSCKLLYYKSEEDAKTKPPLGYINIQEAAIALAMDTSNQFTIHSEGKEYILIADTHRAMMVWVMSLQAKRDAWERKLLPTSAWRESSQRLASNENQEKTMNASQTREPSFEGRSPFVRKHSLQLNGSPQMMRKFSGVPRYTLASDQRRKSTFPDVGRPSSSPEQTSLSTNPQKKRITDIISPTRCNSTPSLTALSSAAAAKTQPSASSSYHPSQLGSIPSISNSHQHPSSNATGKNKSNVLRGMLERVATDGSEASMSGDGRGSKETTDDEDDDDEDKDSPETESASESDRIGVTDADVDEEEEEVGSAALRSDSLTTAEKVTILKHMNGKSDSKSDDDDSKVHLSGLSSLATRPKGNDVKKDESSDPAVRLKELHNELISVKCELAKSLNRENAFKMSLEERDATVTKLEARIEKMENSQTPKRLPLKDTENQETQTIQEKCQILQNQNRFLNDEILKLSRMLQQEQFKNHSKSLRIQEIQGEIDQLKRDYVFLLQSCIRLTCTDGPEMMELYMYGEKRHKQRVLALLDEARKANISLPNLEGITTSLCHVDSLGFKHLFVDKSLILHYVCRQLHHHYSTQLRAYERHVAAWKHYSRLYGDNLHSTEELKALVRGGIPGQLRRRVWCTLYKIRVQDIRDNKGPNYFTNLCNMATDSQLLEQHKRQISLDLLRTMPNNINFCDRNADGIKKMQDILTAFCLHNPKLGYCQGMNFLVGMMLLFMDTEDAFWCLVAIMERYFSPSYFDQNLIGAQADQEVLKDLLKDKLPKLSCHLAALDIELCTITLNWFLSIFIDSVPLETLLRIWDCFLLEGPKVLFRFALAILHLQEENILAKHDTVSIMRQLKAAAKLCFDVEGLVKAAFEELEPFPKRQEITAKQIYYHKILLERAKKKEREMQAMRERERMMAQVELEGPHNHLIECAAVWGKDKVWVCHGHHHGSRISMVNCQENIMYRLHIEFESRVMCMHVPNDDTMIFGTFSHFVHAYHTISRKKMWEICLNSSILSLCSHQRDGVKQVFAGLADGTLAVVENVQGRMPKPEVFYVVIGSSPVTCLQLVGRRLWCASGSNVIILSARTLDLLDQFQTSSNGLDYIYRMICGEQGVWITLRGSSILQLWDSHSLTCRLLYDVRDNYCTRVLKMDETYTNHARITSVLPFDTSVLVGTADGTLIIYDVVARKSPGPSAPSSPRPQPPQAEAGATNVEQIQERLQKLFIEQQIREGEQERSQQDGDTQRQRSDSGCFTAPTLTPVIPLSRRESAVEATSMMTKESEVSLDTASSVSSNATSSDQLPLLGNHPAVGTLDLSSACRLEDMKEEDEECQETTEEANATRGLNLDQIPRGLGIEQRSGRYYSNGYKRASFSVSTPIAEEQTVSNSDDDTSSDAAEGCHGDEEGRKEMKDSETDSSASISLVSSEAGKEKMQSDLRKKENPKSSEASIRGKEQSAKKEQMPERKVVATNQSEYKEQNNPQSVGIDDLLVTESDKQDDRNKNHRLSLFEICKTSSKLREASRRFQSLSAEDIPTWVTKEKPEPVISVRGDVTFKYKNRLPSIKAFLKKEAGDLASFLRSNGSLERLAPDFEQNRPAKPIYQMPSLPPSQQHPLCPSIEIPHPSPESEFAAPVTKPAHRPPSLDVGSGSSKGITLAPPDRIPTPTAIEITVEGTSDTASQEADRSTGEPQQGDSRRSSASVHSMQDDMPYMPNDDDFLSTAQFNDLLQLQDWTRTSRKGSDTASNVSFGSAEVPFAFELILKEKIKISDKPIRCLLQASCNQEPIIISCAGYYGDDEAVLKWNKEGEEKLWTNDPIIEVCPYTHTIKPSPYARSRLPRRASIATTAISGAVDFDGTFGGRGNRTSSPAASAGILVESGIAKMQHLLSRVHDRT